MFRILKSSGINATTRIQTRQTHSPANPLVKVKDAVRDLEINSKLQSELTKIYEENYSEMGRWIADEVNLANSDMSASNPHSRAAAEGFTLINTIQEATLFLIQYDVRCPGISLLDSIRPFHRDYLNTEFKAAYEKLTSARKIQVMLCVEPGVMEKMGITSFPISEQELDRRRQDIPAELLLTESEFLATTAYLNSDTKLFASLNGAGRSKAYYKVPLFAEAVQGVSTELKSGLEKLSFHPSFKRTDIPVYKGIMTSDAAGLFRIATLEEKMANRGFITFPHTMSATEVKEKSYCFTKGTEKYNTLLNIKIKHGAAVDPLHDKKTVGEHEVVVPEGMRCRVIRKYEEFIIDPEKGAELPLIAYELEQF